MDDLLAFLKEAEEQGVRVFTAVCSIKENGLFEKGKEFNVAVALKTVFGLTPHQLHDVVGWLKGIVPSEVLEKSLEVRK